MRVSIAQNANVTFVGAVTTSGNVLLRGLTSTWNAWSLPLGGLGGAATDLALTTTPNGSGFVLFVTRADGVVRSKTWNGSWVTPAWETLPTPPSGAARISATRTAPQVPFNTLYVAALGKNGAVYTVEKVGTQPWGSWESRSTTGWASDVSMCATLEVNLSNVGRSVTYIRLAASRPTQRVWATLGSGQRAMTNWTTWVQFTKEGSEGSNTVAVSYPALSNGSSPAVEWSAMQSISGTTLHSSN